MTRTSSLVGVVLCLALASVSLACLWDSDTLQMERLRFPGVLEIITGKFVRHSRAYYEWRIVDRKKKLETKPNDPALIDDLAVAYAKLGRPAEGIPLLEQVLKEHPDRYETLSNLGTLLFFAGRLDDSKNHIRRALEINPDAHFGREKYQLLLTEYLQEIEKEKAAEANADSPPAFEFPTPGSVGFARFLERKLTGVDYQKATKGVLGMMHFANFESPILLAALGDLLRHGTAERDAALHACRAYLRASEFETDPLTAKRFRAMAAQSLSMHLPEKVLFTQIERDLKGETEDATTWFAEIESNEQRWIAENRDVDLEFAAKYYDSLDSTIDAVRKDLRAPAAPAEQPTHEDSVSLNGVQNNATADEPAGRMIAYHLLCAAALVALVASLRRLKSTACKSLDRSGYK